jgi:hypothetical protein
MNSKEALKEISKRVNNYVDCLRYSDKKKEEINDLIKVVGNDLDKMKELQQENKNFKKFIEILKKSYVSIKILGDLKVYNLINNVEIDGYATDKEYKLLKEGLENEI